MIIRYFRSNQSVLVLAIPILCLVFWAVHFFGGPDAAQLSGYMLEKLDSNTNFHPVFWRSLALILIGIQALFINSLIQKTEIFNKLSHVPLLFTVLIGTMLSYRGSFDPGLGANLFLLLAINEILKVYHQNSVIGTTFNAGFWIGVAALFEPALILVIIPSIIGILMLRAADWRELLLLIGGAALPTFFLLVGCFMFDTTYQIPMHYFHPNFEASPFTSDPLLRALMILGGLLFIVCLIYYFRSLRGTIIRIRKMRLVLFYFLLSLVIIAIYLVYTNTGYFTGQLLLLPMVFIGSYMYMHVSRTFFIDTWFYGLLVIWGFFVYNLYFV